MGNAQTSLGLADHRRLHQEPNVARQGGMENLSHVMSVKQNMTKKHNPITPTTITTTGYYNYKNYKNYKENQNEYNRTGN